MGSIISTFKVVSSFRFKMMFYLLLVVPLVSGGTLPDNPDLLLGPGGQYDHPIDPDYYSQNEVYKIKDKDDCHPVERTVYKDECLPYIEKTCYTQQVEQCKDVYEKNCTSVIDESEHRECFDVTELICKLVENIQYEMVDETYTVQRCTRVTDRVCDTVYDLDVTTKDDFQCIDLEHQYCWDEEKIVKDRTCVFGIDFECGKHKDKDGKGAVKCEKVPKKKQNCHTEPMKRCELEVRSRPKKAKKYVYHKDCKPVTRKVCDTCEKKTLSPVCDKIHKQVCKYKPEEKCHEEKKEYCFKTEKIIIDKVCVGEKKEVYDETFSYV